MTIKEAAATVLAVALLCLAFAYAIRNSTQLNYQNECRRTHVAREC